jgi:hypothetical protein
VALSTNIQIQIQIPLDFYVVVLPFLLWKENLNNEDQGGYSYGV